jgi:hypothetical protein
MTVDGDTHGLAIRPPEPAADAVLAKGVNDQLTMTRLHGLLDLFFQIPRTQALAVTFSQYIERLSFFRHHICSGKKLHHILDIKPLGGMVIADAQGV